MKRLTNRQKFIASACLPTYGGFSTWDEVREAKLLARGKYWNDEAYAEFISFSPNGEREYFGYDDEWKFDVKKCARLWAKGKKKVARELYESFWDRHCFKKK